MRRPSSPTDLCDNEGASIQHLMSKAKPGGRPEAYPTWAIRNAIFYRLRSGCSWLRLPQDRPPWRIVAHDFQPWRQDGIW